MITTDTILADIRKLGVGPGDFLLVRGALGRIGRVRGGATTVIEALLACVGQEGTIASLSFTDSSFIRRADPLNPYHLSKKSYAGALPNAMIEYHGSFRSGHPTCSYVAIGKYAEAFTTGHDENSGAYEPIRHLLAKEGKCLLIGCVGSSPGFTTTHLAEADLGYLRKVIFPWLNTTYYYDKNGVLKLFRRKDLGLCSNSFYKFYAHYVAREILTTGYVGQAYSVIAPAKNCYGIEKEILENNSKFNICDSPECFMCNARRWDRLHRLPAFIYRKIRRKLRKFYPGLSSY